MSALGFGFGASLAGRMARLAVAQPAPRPTRLFVYYVPHGHPVEHFEPQGSGETLNLAASGLGILSPLEPFKKHVAVVRGIGMNDGANNHGAIRAMLTGFSEGGTTDSIDQLVAQGLGVTAHALGARPYAPGAGFNSDSFLIKHGGWVTPTEDPVLGAEALFKTLPAAGEPNPVDETAFRQQALALTEREIEAMQSSLAWLTTEQSKLSLHLEAVRALKASAGGGSGTPPSCESRPALPAVEAVRGLDVLDQANFGLVLDAHLEAAAHAFLCGSARVVTLQNMYVNADMNMNFAGGPGIAKGHHDPISHSWDATGRGDFAVCQRWFYEQLAQKMLSVLDQPDPLDPSAPGRTVLDNTLILCCSEVSDGANHNSDASEIWVGGGPLGTYLPIVLIGGAGGFLKTQQVVTVSRSHVDVLATVGAALGVPLATIGNQNVSVIEELRA